MWQAFSADFLLTRTLFAVLSSTTESSIMFNVLHDASHYAISTNPLVNNAISRITNSWNGWNHTLWLYHHVYYHHTYTGTKFDPDKKMYNFDGKHVPIKTFIIYGLLPGQNFGQCLWYIYTAFTNRLEYFGNFKATFPQQKTPYYQWPEILIMVSKFILLCKLGVVPCILYIATGNLLYFINIIGDHDLSETHENNYDGNNWALRQIHNSGNFANDNILWTLWFGGINHQIEHHLFPNMSNFHYCTVAPIVKAFCLERRIPYVHLDTLEDVFKSFSKNAKTAKTA
jgi:linoleoyl-CoA desaturase